MNHIYLDCYLDNNLGDDLMIKGVVSQFEDCMFYITTDNSVVAQNYSEYKNLKIVDKKETQKIMKKIDVYLKLGGSIFQYRNYKDTIGRYIKYNQIKRLKRKGVRFAVMGCNTGPFHSRASKRLAAKEMNLCEFVTVRDLESKNFVQKNAKKTNVYLYDDIVFELLDNFKENSISRSKSNKYRLGVTAYRSINNPGLNWDLYESIVDIIKIINTKECVEVYIYAFDTEQENDLSAAHHIQYILSKSNIDSKIIPYLGSNLDSFLSVYSAMDAMVAVRFHGAVMSDYYGIPYIPIAYSNKLYNYIKDLNYSFDVQKVSSLGVQKLNSVEPADFFTRERPPLHGHLKHLKKILDE